MAKSGIDLESLRTPGGLNSLPAEIKIVLYWRNHPEEFVRHMFRAEPDEWQTKFMRAIATNDRVAVASGHGVGKTTVLAWTIFWWLLTRSPATIPCTAPTAHQLSDVLWGELANWLGKMHKDFRDMFDLKQDSLVMREAPKESRALARTARKETPEAFQGFHSQNLLLIADEASGIEDIIFEVGQGSLSTPGAKLVMTGNPTRLSGFFFEAFHRARDNWHTMQVSCLDAKQVAPGFVEQMRQQYGEDSDPYRVRVLGQFPRMSDSQLIATEQVNEARARVLEPREWSRFPLVLGVDVARGGGSGARSVIIRRQGPKVWSPRSWRDIDTMELAGMVVEEARLHQASAIYVDGTGVGAGVVHRLKQLNLPVVDVVVGAQARDRLAYVNLRSELWGRLRDWISGTVDLPDFEDLAKELTQIEYKYDAKMRMQLERKDQMVSRGLASPDFADALALTFFDDVGLTRLQSVSTAARPVTPAAAAGWT